MPRSAESNLKKQSCHEASGRDVIRPEGTQVVKPLLECNDNPGIAQAARWVYLLVNFVLVFNYTFVIMDSYDFCATLGVSQSDSGRMVGNYMLGFCPGAFVMWVIARRTPGLWRSSPRCVLSAGLTCQMVGALTYLAIASKATDMARGMDLSKDSGAVSSGGSSYLAVVLMTCRFISGMGSGICQQFYVASMLHLTPVAERPEHTTRWVFSGMLAIGAGPMIAAGLGLLRDNRTSASAAMDPDFTQVGYGQVLVVLLAFAAVLGFHPDLESIKDEMEREVVDDHAETPTNKDMHSQRSVVGLDVVSRRVAVVCGCLVMANLRAFGISAVEVVTASLLEDKYGWGTYQIGVVIGLIFLCCIPIRVMHLVLGGRMLVGSWIRIMGIVALFGCCFLFSPACLVSNQTFGMDCAGTLVLAGVIVFPTFYMGEALACGILHQHVLPDGSFFDGNHSQLWYNLAQGLGRFLGPWISRWAAEAYGQNVFAMQQMAVTCVFLVVFETFVRSNTRNSIPNSDSNNDVETP